MTDHTCTKKIGGDSFYFNGHPSQTGNCYDSLVTPLGTQRVGPIFRDVLSSMLFHMLDLSVSHLVIYLWHFILLCLNNCGVIYYFACE